MESFFGRMKCELLDLIALCPSADVVARMIDGYMTAYNTQHYQYALAGLTPSEYYAYVITGIYPVDNYYGIKGTELMPVKALVAARLSAAADKARRAGAFLMSAPADLIAELTDGRNWGAHPELAYIYEMRELF